MKKEINRYKVSFKNPFNLTSEKVTQTPRVYTTGQIIEATENILLEELESKETPELLIQAIHYILKDFFLYMHQTGLYNRQFKLWRTLGNIKHVLISKPQIRFFEKKELGFYLIDLSIDEQYPAVRVIVQENNLNFIKEFKDSLSWVLGNSNVNRLKGVLCFLFNEPTIELLKKFASTINVLDPISKYESIINETKDVRLNAISYYKSNNNYNFSPVFPPVKTQSKREKIET